MLALVLLFLMPWISFLRRLLGFIKEERHVYSLTTSVVDTMSSSRADEEVRRIFACNDFIDADDVIESLSYLDSRMHPLASDFNLSNRLWMYFTRRRNSDADTVTARQADRKIRSVMLRLVAIMDLMETDVCDDEICDLESCESSECPDNEIRNYELPPTPPREL